LRREHGVSPRSGQPGAGRQDGQGRGRPLSKAPC